MAGRIPQHFIDELISRVDIVELIDARVPLKKSGREFAACCPFHTEKTPSFTVSPSKQFYHCFGCGAHGTALGFLMEYEHLEFPEAVRQLAASVGLEVPEEAGAKRESGGNQYLYEISERAAQYYQRQLKEHDRAIDYLKGRGLTGEIAQTFGIGYAPQGWSNLVDALGTDERARQALAACGLAKARDSGGHYDAFRDRIMFPIRDTRGRTIAFGGRILDEGEPKYLNSPETALFHKGRELYGLYEARKALRDIPRLLVVEGYMDVVALAQLGVRYAVATLGTATTPEHLNRLFRVTPEVVFCFDGDKAGRRAAWRALENALPAIEKGRQIRFLFLPEGEDPDSLIRAEGAAAFATRIERAVPLSRFLLDQLSGQVDLGSVDGRARLVELARPLVAKLKDPVYREMLLDALGEIARMDRQRLSMLMQTRREPESPQGRPRKARHLGGSRLTPVRRAVAMLLAQPALAGTVTETGALREVQVPGTDVLAELLEFLGERPNINTAGILEHYRGTEAGAAFMKLAGADLLTPEDGMAQELADILARLTGRELAGQQIEARLAQLQGKAPSAMSAEEKAELVRLLHARQRRTGPDEDA